MSIWMIPENCTFRSEEDGTGYAYHADTDRLHPLNQAAVRLMQQLAEHGASEDELFEKLWPEVERSVQECVREDIAAFLKAMKERACVDAEEAEENPKVVPLKKADKYSPPQVDDFGRAGLNQPIRNQSESKSSGGACTDGGSPGRPRDEGDGGSSENAPPVSESDKDESGGGRGPELSGCAPSGFAPSNDFCGTGSSPTGDNGFCTTVGSTPTVAACDDAGHAPVSDNCLNGSGPLNNNDCTVGTDPAYVEGCDYGNTPDPNAVGYCDDGYSPAGVIPNEPTLAIGTCTAGTLPEDAKCVQGVSPQGQTTNGYCHDIGFAPVYANCYLGSGPVGPSGERCNPSGATPSDGQCTSGSVPDFPGHSGGGFRCGNGNQPDDADCDDGNAPTFAFVPSNY